MYSNTRLNLEEAFRLLNARRLPGRLMVAESAVFLRFEEHDIPVLISFKYLVPLGNPAPNATKYFASVVIVRLANDEDWLGKATLCISRYWKSKNNRKKNSTPQKHAHTFWSR